MKCLWSLLLRRWEPLCVLMPCFVKLLVMVLWFVWNVAKRCCCVSKCVVFIVCLGNDKFQIFWNAMTLHQDVSSKFGRCFPVVTKTPCFQDPKLGKKNCFPETYLSSSFHELSKFEPSLKKNKCLPRKQTWVPAILQALCGFFPTKDFMSAVKHYPRRGGFDAPKLKHQAESLAKSTSF